MFFQITSSMCCLCVAMLFFFSWITWVPGLITLAGTTIEPLHHLSTQSSAHRHNQDSLAHCSHTERKREGERLIADFILSHSSCSCSQISIPRKSILQFCKVLTQQGAGTSSFPLFFLILCYTFINTPLLLSVSPSLTPSQYRDRKSQQQCCNFSCIASVSFQFSAARTQVSEVELSVWLQSPPCILNEFASVRVRACVLDEKNSPLLPTVSEVIIVLLLWSRSIFPHRGAALGGSTILNHTAARAKTLTTHTHISTLCVSVCVPVCVC